jgi:hypothetical protein
MKALRDKWTKTARDVSSAALDAYWEAWEGSSSHEQLERMTAPGSASKKRKWRALTGGMDEDEDDDDDADTARVRKRKRGKVAVAADESEFDGSDSTAVLVDQELART